MSQKSQELQIAEKFRKIVYSCETYPHSIVAFRYGILARERCSDKKVSLSHIDLSFDILKKKRKKFRNSHIKELQRRLK